MRFKHIKIIALDTECLFVSVPAIHVNFDEIWLFKVNRLRKLFQSKSSRLRKNGENVESEKTVERKNKF